MSASPKYKILGARVLSWCCLYHMTSSGSCQPGNDKLFSKLPLELVDEVVAQLAALGTQHAYTAALIHARYSKTLNPRLDDPYLSFAKAETEDHLINIFRNRYPRKFSTLRLGVDLADATYFTIWPLVYMDLFAFATDNAVQTLQLGSIKISKCLFGNFVGVEEIFLLRAYQQTKFLTRVANLKTLHLLNFNLRVVGSIPMLAQLQDIWFYKMVYAPWEPSGGKDDESVKKLYLRRKNLDQAGISSEYADETTRKFEKIQRLYMVEIVATSFIPFCAIEEERSQTNKGIAIKYYTFHCRGEWRYVLVRLIRLMTNSQFVQ